MKWIYRGALLIFVLDCIPVLFAGTPNHWGASILADRGKLTVACFLVSILIPYRNLTLKSLFLAWGISELLLFLNFFLNYYETGFQIPVIWTASFIVLTWMFKIWFRDYDKGNDPLDDVHFFQVGIIPKSPQDFFLSLFREPIGGSGIYVQGKFYYYRKGKLVIQNRKFLERAQSKYQIRCIRPVDSSRKAVLEGLVDSKYSRWSLLYNCKTVLSPILGRGGRPLF